MDTKLKNTNDDVNIGAHAGGAVKAAGKIAGKVPGKGGLGNVQNVGGVCHIFLTGDGEKIP